MKKRIVVSLVVSSFLSIINFLLIVYLLVQTFYLIGLPNKEATSFPSNGFVPFIVFFSILILPLLFHVYIEIVLLKKSKTIKNVPNGFNKKMFWSAATFLFFLIAALLLLVILFFLKKEYLLVRISSFQELLLLVAVIILFCLYFSYCCILFNPFFMKRLNKRNEW